MILDPFDTDLVCDRLRERAPNLRFIGGAADFVTAYQDARCATPAAYVVLADELITTTALTGGVLQIQVRSYIDVAVCVQLYRAADRGAAHVRELRPTVGEVRRALAGFRPPVPVEVTNTLRPDGRGRLLRYSADRAWWADRYSITLTDRVTA